MFKPLIHFVLKHLMQQNEWAAPQLKPFAHRTLCIDFKVAQVSLTVLDQGELTVAADSSHADATLHLPPSLAMRLIRRDTLAMQLVKIEGDSAFATEIAKILAAIRWDVESDLSHVVGDMAAYQVVALSQHTFNQLRTGTQQLSEMLVEYWQEERPILAKKTAIYQFNDAVDTLREDLARLQVRLEKLQSTLPQGE